MHAYKLITPLLVSLIAAQPALAEPLLPGRLAEAAGGSPFAARANTAVHGEQGAYGRRQAIVGDGAGNVAGANQGAFTTQSGAQGARSSRFKRGADGSVQADSHGAVSGDKGSAQRDASFTRTADGSASGERTTTATNNKTGVTYDASTSYSKGSGISRSASCTDASGNSVACISR